MKRTINYTGRKRISRERISISFSRQNGSVVSFSLSRLDLSGLDLPSNALISVEAYYRTELKRIQLGQADSFHQILSTDLTDMGYPENLKFRIIVVDPSTKKILAYADRIAPEEPSGRKSILPVEFRDLGNRIWMITYEGDEGSPVLCINNRIPDIQNIAKRDSQFFMQVYPCAIREILTYMVFVEGVESVRDPSVDWNRDWLEFTKSMGIQPPLSLTPDDNQQFDKDEVFKWIDNVVEAFCNRYSQIFEKFVSKMEENR
ncbi:MAG TPA: hypothetical protein PLY82_13710 [Methanosarcina thermophila]|nr:hypothetical protein [Methanosarcina thermophila]